MTLLVSNNLFSVCDAAWSNSKHQITMEKMVTVSSSQFWMFTGNGPVSACLSRLLNADYDSEESLLLAIENYSNSELRSVQHAINDMASNGIVIHIFGGSLKTTLILTCESRTDDKKLGAIFVQDRWSGFYISGGLGGSFARFSDMLDKPDCPIALDTTNMHGIEDFLLQFPDPIRHVLESVLLAIVCDNVLPVNSCQSNSQAVLQIYYDGTINTLIHDCHAYRYKAIHEFTIRDEAFLDKI